MADIVELRMNVAALKRFDPYARDIVDSATHVALYTFEGNEWEKTSIEGALFVYSRNGKPFHSMLIMNRLSTKNLIEPLTDGLELQVQEPFLLYRNSKRRIYGIWFYDKDECVRIAAKMNSLATDSSKSPSAEPKMSNSQQINNITPAGGVDIFSMLSKAQDDYNSNKGLGAAPPPRAEPPAQNSHNALGSHEEVTSQSVMDFFAKAGSGSVPLPAAPVAPGVGAMFGAARPPPADGREGPMLLQRLMSNPHVHSVEHIEKQQRCTTPGETVAADTSRQRFSGFKLKVLPGDTKRKAGQKVEGTKTQNQLRVKSSDKSNSNHSAESNGQSQLESDLSFMRVSSPKASSPLATLLSQSEEQRALSVPPGAPETPQKPALMPPTMFTSSASKAGVERPPLESLLTPIKPPAPEEPRPEPLTRNQLLQAFNYLIKNDADFVNKLHEAYVKSFSELVS